MENECDVSVKSECDTDLKSSKPRATIRKKLALDQRNTSPVNLRHYPWIAWRARSCAECRSIAIYLLSAMETLYGCWYAFGNIWSSIKPLTNHVSPASAASQLRSIARGIPRSALHGPLIYTILVSDCGVELLKRDGSKSLFLGLAQDGNSEIQCMGAKKLNENKRLETQCLRKFN